VSYGGTFDPAVLGILQVGKQGNAFRAIGERNGGRELDECIDIGEAALLGAVAGREDDRGSEKSAGTGIPAGAGLEQQGTDVRVAITVGLAEGDGESTCRQQCEQRKGANSDSHSVPPQDEIIDPF
jgi:hypothetical protein